jgi:hypothetical protein
MRDKLVSTIPAFLREAQSAGKYVGKAGMMAKSVRPQVGLHFKRKRILLLDFYRIGAADNY